MGSSVVENLSLEEFSHLQRASSSTQSENGSMDHNSHETPGWVETTQKLSFRGVRTRLYISHFLSSWNSRIFEFGAVLFLAAVFPATLLPASVYAAVRAASAIFLSPMVGQMIDNEDRLKMVRISIGE